MSRLKLKSCELDLLDGSVWLTSGQSNTRLNDILFRLFMCLVKNQGQDVSHDALRQSVWNDRLECESPDDRKQKMRKVYIAITRLRRALRDDARPYRHIISPRVGSYRFQPLEPDQITGPAPSITSRPTP